jgi:hypothetical protein
LLVGGELGGRAGVGSPVQGDGKPVGGEALAHPRHRAGTDPAAVRHLAVAADAAAHRLIGLQQNPGMARRQRRRVAAGQHGLRFGALGGGEGDMMLLAHPGTPQAILGTGPDPRMPLLIRQPHPVTTLRNELAGSSAP